MKANVKLQNDEGFSKWIRIQNLDSNNFNESIRYTNEKGYNFLKKSKLFGGELLISKTGEHLGRAYLFNPINKIEKYTLADNIFLLRLKNTKHNGFVFSFINSVSGRKLLLRWSQGTGQPTIIKDSLRSIRLPIIAEEEAIIFDDLVNEYYKKIQKSQTLYQQATDLLEQELGISDFKKDNRKSRITSLSELSEANRIDAQCFKPEYLQYESFIRENNTYNRLSSLLNRISKGNQQNVSVNGKYPYVSIKDISGIDINSQGNVSTPQSIAQREDLLLAVTGATIGKIGIIHRYDSLSFSGDILGLSVDKNQISPWYLLAILSSPIGQTQFNRWITGSTNGHLSPSDVRKVIVPRMKIEHENTIEELLKKSIDFSIESELLLEQAKNRVEQLIEQAAAKNN